MIVQIESGPDMGVKAGNIDEWNSLGRGVVQTRRFMYAKYFFILLNLG